MSRIRIQNFGPIKQGLSNSRWLDIRKVTIFIGNQGSGKSTIAKLISTLVWIEKAIVRGDFASGDLTSEKFIEHCSYQNIGNYFKLDSKIEFIGEACSIKYDNGNISVNKIDGVNYAFPKIMYVPSERNLVSSVDNVEELKGLPKTLYTFAKEYDRGLKDLVDLIDLPLNNNIKLEYQKSNKKTVISGIDYDVNLTEASSGFQSFVPLFIVSNYLATFINKKRNNSVHNSSINEDRKLREKVAEILNNPNLSEEIKQASLETLSSSTKYSAFVNIVEEPEQNLFPTSQRQALNSLVRINNTKASNLLIMTTHSPYLINYLTLAVKANMIKSSLPSHLGEKLNRIVPLDATVKPGEFAIYQLNESGEIEILETYNGLPTDENELNEKLGENNELFAELLEIEQKL